MQRGLGLVDFVDKPAFVYIFLGRGRGYAHGLYHTLHRIASELLSSSSRLSVCMLSWVLFKLIVQ